MNRERYLRDILFVIAILIISLIAFLGGRFQGTVVYEDRIVYKCEKDRFQIYMEAALIACDKKLKQLEFDSNGDTPQKLVCK